MPTPWRGNGPVVGSSHAKSSLGNSANSTRDTRRGAVRPGSGPPSNMLQLKNADVVAQTDRAFCVSVEYRVFPKDEVDSINVWFPRSKAIYDENRYKFYAPPYMLELKETEIANVLRDRGAKVTAVGIRVYDAE